MDRSPYYIFGLIVGMAVVLVLTVLVGLLVGRNARGERKYDERQTAARLRGYRTAFWTLAAYLCLCGVFDMATGIIWADLMTLLFIGICFAITVFVVICIHEDAYFAINDRPRFYMAMFAVIAAVNLIVVVCNIAGGQPLVTDGALNFRCMNAVIVLMFAALFSALAIRRIQKSRDEEDGV